ncbi:hypothetical protein ACQW5G_01440 [Fructilactobacillus sp. Tb1]|uniref:hypothetical protein n=1 Tax=Fructilactobacillus sp. Tb1 TaxID=3422304 RepID=UPI003D2D6403
MIKQISVTFGSKDILDKIAAKYPDRNLALFSPSDNATGLQLVDYSGKESIFATPVVYNVVSHTGIDDWNHYIDYVEVTPDAQRRKVLNATVSNFMTDIKHPEGMYSAYYMTSAENSDKKVLLTLWKDKYSFLQWKNNNSDNFMAFDKFKDDFSVNYHNSGYERVEK